jgi:hypothetical protein
MNFLETGTIGVKSGPLMAAPDKFSITVQGKGGHGAMPHETVDALLVASMVCVALLRRWLEVVSVILQPNAVALTWLDNVLQGYLAAKHCFPVYCSHRLSSCDSWQNGKLAQLHWVWLWFYIQCHRCEFLKRGVLDLIG